MMKTFALAAIAVTCFGPLGASVTAYTTESPGGESDPSSEVRESVRDLPELAREAALAEFDLEVALDRLNAAEAGIPARRAVRAEYYASKQYQDAIRDLREAQKAFNDENDRLLASLEKNPAYRQARAMQEKIERELEYLGGVASLETRTYLAGKKLHHATQASRMRMEAEQEDGQFQAARIRLENASRTLRQLREQFEDYYYNHPAVASALDRVDRAEEAYLDALRKVAGSQAAYEQALVNREYYAELVARHYRYYDATPWWIWRSFWRGGDGRIRYFRVPQGWNFNITGW